VEIIKTVEHDRAHVKCQNLNKSVVPCFTDRKKKIRIHHKNRKHELQLTRVQIMECPVYSTQGLGRALLEPIAHDEWAKRKVSIYRVSKHCKIRFRLIPISNLTY